MSISSKKLGISIILIIFIGVIFYSLNTLNTKDWTMCRNEKAGYQFYFPSEWSVYGDSSSNGEGPSSVKTTSCSGYGVSLRDERYFDYSTPIGSLPGITIRIDPMFPNAPLQNATNYKTLMIDGIEFYSINESDSYRIIGIKDNQVIRVFPHTTLSDKTLHAILSTFKFIDN